MSTSLTSAPRVTMADSDSGVAPNRRRRSRISSVVPGWIVDPNNPAEPWEVRVKDVSRLGVGFESCQSLPCGESGRLRIGRGPIELARTISVVRCEPTDRGTFRIGAVFC